MSYDETLKFVLRERPIVDVRTPSEFAKGHIPGAVNIPLFTDSERADVGTIYKKEGRDNAIKAGLTYVGPKMRSIVEAVEALDQKTIGLHCWRGGMRSSSVAWLLRLYGFDVEILEGGYKSFRRFALATFDKVTDLVVLGGRTGSAKTRVLLELADRGNQVIDLEGLANHRGSAFGSVGLEPQPTQQQFENDIAVALVQLDGRPVWVEDESPNIGVVRIPDAIMGVMRNSTVVVLHVPDEERVDFLVETYGEASVEELRDCFQRIEKRLGAERVRNACEALDAGDLKSAVSIALEYYDRAYDFGLEKRPPTTLHQVDVTQGDVSTRLERIAEEIWEKG